MKRGLTWSITLIICVLKVEGNGRARVEGTGIPGRACTATNTTCTLNGMMDDLHT